MAKGLPRSVMAIAIAALIAVGLMYLTRQTEGFATGDLALVGIKLKTSLTAIKNAFANLPMRPISLDPDTLKTIFTELANHNIDFTKLKMSIIETDTGKVIWDPAGDYSAGKPISAFPDSTDTKLYILYINLFNIGTSQCLNATACFMPEDTTVDSKYRGKCIQPSPNCKENLLSQTDRNAMEKITPSLLSQIMNLQSSGPNATPESIALLTPVMNIPGYGAITAVLGSFKDPVSLEGYIYESPVPNNRPDIQIVSDYPLVVNPPVVAPPVVTAFTDYKSRKEGFAATSSTDVSNLVTATGSPAIPRASVSLPTPTDTNGGLSTGAIIGIVVLCLALVAVIGFGIHRYRSASYSSIPVSAPQGGARRPGKN